MNDRLIPITDSAARPLHPLDDLHEPERGSILMTNGSWGTAWQRYFADGLWHPVGGGRARSWEGMLSYRNLVLVYDAPVRPAPQPVLRFNEPKGGAAMITRERLESTAYGQSLLALMRRLVPYRVTDWGNNDSDDKESNRPGDREQVVHLSEANVITSLLNNDSSHHHLLLDIDHPSWLIPSTTPGHYHLYVEVNGSRGMSTVELDEVLNALANAGVIEPGYAGASKARGFTSVRLPWIEKEKGMKQHD